MRAFSMQMKVRSGLTLVEVMIATTLTLMLMLALAQGFKVLSDSVSEGRTKLALSDQLRGISAILRHDLDRCTASHKVVPTYPGPGYFKYYDGPIWDMSALQTNFSANEPLAGSRWGDIDDILMFTAKAYPGESFRGTVPQALLIISQLNEFDKAGVAPDSAIAQSFTSSITLANAWTTEVSIESDLAEIVWFMMPLIEGNRLPIPYPSTTPYIPTTTTTTVVDVVPSSGDGMPDQLALCRRVLPIRPDIDLNPLPNTSQYRTIIQNLLSADNAPQIAASTSNLASFRTAMHQFYQRCDLSLKPKKWASTTDDFLLSVAANSLDDLQLPENRFAHFTYPVSEGLPTWATTLPILALTDETTSANYRTVTDPFYTNVFTGSLDTVSNRGFLPPYFMRARFDGTPVLSEIVATNVLGFDAKIFDPTASQIGNTGPDGVFGGSGSTIAGIPGTDDVAVSPSDPGYINAIKKSIRDGENAPPIFAQGAYVDMGWGIRLLTPSTVSPLTDAQKITYKDYFIGSASGVYNISGDGVTFDPSLFRSGSYYNHSSIRVYQPSYDTYTNFYDIDGERMDFSGNFPFYRGGLRRFNIPVAQGLVDQAYDGIQNPLVMSEAYPPAYFDLTSIKVTIRVQDATAGALQQMSVIQSFK